MCENILLLSYVNAFNDISRLTSIMMMLLFILKRETNPAGIE